MSGRPPQFERRECCLVDGRKVTLSPATPDSAEAGLAYMREILPEVTSFICATPEEFTTTAEEERQYLAGLDVSRGGLRMIAEAEGRIVGSLNVSPDHRRRLAHTSSLGMTLRPEFRGAGLGTAMMRALIGWAERHPVTELLLLDAYADNEPALRLYRRVGFIEAGRIPRRMKFGPGVYKDLIDMYRDVSGGAGGLSV